MGRKYVKTQTSVSLVNRQFLLTAEQGPMRICVMLDPAELDELERQIQKCKIANSG